MSVIKIESIYEEQRIAKQSGKPYKVTVVTGTKYGSGDSWEQPIFANNKSLLRQLSEFGKGDVANFKYEENGKYHDLISIEIPDKALIDKIDSGEVNTSAKSQGGSGKKTYSGGSNTSSDKMSKAEWAEKDRLTIIRIAKAVALKAAIDNTKVGTKPCDLMEMADEFLPYLMDMDLSTGSGSGGDPLDPPTDD